MQKNNSMKNFALYKLTFACKQLTVAFISCFLLTWPLWNWEIVFLFLFYHSDDLFSYTGFHSHLEVIQQYAVGFKPFWGPSLSAIVYAFVSETPEYKN